MLVQWQAATNGFSLRFPRRSAPTRSIPAGVLVFLSVEGLRRPQTHHNLPSHRIAFGSWARGGLHPGGVVVPALRRDYPVPSTNSGMSIKGQFAFRQRQVGLSAQGRYSGQCGVSRRPDGARGRSAQRAWSAHGPLAGRCVVAHPAVCWPLPDPSFKTVADPI